MYEGDTSVKANKFFLKIRLNVLLMSVVDGILISVLMVSSVKGSLILSMIS